MDLTVVQNSYGRCCNSPQFFDHFYARFLKSHPSIAPMFARTDMERQKWLLRHGISMTLLHAAGRTTGTAALDRIGKSHSRTGFNIEPGLYQHWVNSLVATIKETDPEWNAALDRQWREALQTGIDHIASQY